MRAVEQAFDGGHIAFEQIRQIEFGSGDIDTGLQSAVEHDLVTGVAHGRGILVANGLKGRQCKASPVAAGPSFS